MSAPLLIGGIPDSVVALFSAIAVLIVLGVWLAKSDPEAEERARKGDLWNQDDEEDSGAC